MEQAELSNLFREDLLAGVTVGIDELLAELGKTHLVFRRIDELENLRCFEQGNGFTVFFPNLIRDIVNVVQFRTVLENTQ